MKINRPVALAGVFCFLWPGFGALYLPLLLLHTIIIPRVQGGFNRISVDSGPQSFLRPPHPTGPSRLSI